jgi:hypothetical protein
VFIAIQQLYLVCSNADCRTGNPLCTHTCSLQQARRQVSFNWLRRRQGSKRDNHIDTDDCYAAQTVTAGIIELLVALGCNIILRQLLESGKLQQLHPHPVPLAEQCHHAEK